MGQEIGAPPDQVGTPAKEVSRGSHFSRIDVGHGEGAAAQEGGDLLGAHLVVLDLRSVDGPHVQRVAQHELDSLPAAEVGEPVPGEDAFGADHQLVTEGSDGFQEGFGSGGEVAVEDHLALVREYAQVHPSRVQVDAAVERSAASVESHGGLLS